MKHHFHQSSLWTRVFLSVFLLLTLSFHINIDAAAQTAESLNVTFLDVGQGDSSVISTSNGFDILIDAGPVSAGPSVLAFLTNHDIDSVEVIVISHNHEDHLGGLVEVLQSAIRVDTIYYNGNTCTTQTCLNVWEEMSIRGITPIAVQNGDTFAWDTISAQIINPQTSHTGDENEDSVVMDFTFFDVGVLYTGDIGFSTESNLLNQGLLHSTDILKVAHHGSAYSTSTAFLSAISPTFSVVSVGANNTYDHPNSETITRLTNAGTAIIRTDLNGDISFTFNETEPQFETFTYLPLFVNGRGNEPNPDPINPPDPIPGENIHCNTYGDVEVCASVSNATPTQYSYVTVYGRLVVNGSAQVGKTMYSTWHYKTTTSYCDGNATDEGGIVSCTREISRATKGYQVNINVTIDGYSVTTAFTTQ